MDLAAIKADLKAWERDFKSEHGREPTKADIKAVPAIGGRKQYRETKRRVY